MRARIRIAPELAYKNQRFPGIPPNSTLIIDLEVLSIGSEIANSNDKDDLEFITEIIAEAKDGDRALERRDFVNALKWFEAAYTKIQSSRFRDFRSYLFNKSKMNNLKKTDSKQRNL